MKSCLCCTQTCYAIPNCGHRDETIALCSTGQLTKVECRNATELRVCGPADAALVAVVLSAKMLHLQDGIKLRVCTNSHGERWA